MVEAYQFISLLSLFVNKQITFHFDPYEWLVRGLLNCAFWTA